MLFRSVEVRNVGSSDARLALLLTVGVVHLILILGLVLMGGVKRRRTGMSCHTWLLVRRKHLNFSSQSNRIGVR